MFINTWKRPPYLGDLAKAKPRPQQQQQQQQRTGTPALARFLFKKIKTPLGSIATMHPSPSLLYYN